MKLKYLFPLFLSALLLAGCGPQKAAPTTGSKTQPLTTKLLVNQLPIKEEPFTILVPHSTGRLFTFAAIGADKASAASLDLEYQSGDLLKGAQATFQTPIANPFFKAIILGSCSTGGKCTFDTNLTAGTMKFKLNFPGQDVTHILKGDFVFITGQNNLPDGKFVFAPAKQSAKSNLIMLDSFGLPKPTDQDPLLYPVVISAVDNKPIVGTLTVNQAGIGGAAIYDGANYQPLKITQNGGATTITLNNVPWSMPANITRDDNQDSPESLTLYILGPIVLFK